jgi:predicted ATPase/DNA-binding CsgD family transcriptional regulator
MIRAGNTEAPKFAVFDAPPPDGNLPAPLTTLIGRAQDLERSTALLLETRLLTLTGPAGVGKTSLALDIAHATRERFPGGSWIVDLSAVRDASDVLGVVSRRLGLGERPMSAADALEDFLHEREALLVLDNLEQIAGAAQPVSALLNTGPGVRVIATSRQALRLRAERRYPLRTLALPESGGALEKLAQTPSIALFLARAREVNPDYRLAEDNAEDIVALCSRLDGLPLALELAASRTDILEPRAILAYLESSGGVPSAGPADGPERHRSLQAALDWSFDLLDEPHKALFRRLGAFSGGFDAASAKAVARTDESGLDALAALAELADRSLILPAPGAGARFRTLSTVRDYALERLAAAGELETVRDHHAAYFLELAERLEATLLTSDDPAAFERFDLEYGNMDEALRWLLSPSASSANGELGLRLTVARRPFWDRRGNFNEESRWLESALALAGTAHLGLRVRGLINLAHILTVHYEFHLAEAKLEEALGLCRALNANDLRGWALVRLCELQTLRNDLDPATDSAALALEAARGQNDPSLLIASLTASSKLALIKGDFAAAVAPLEEGLAVTTRAQRRHAMAYFTWLFGSRAYLSGDAKQAALYHERALEMFLETGDLKRAAFAAADLGEALLTLQDLERALPFLEQGKALLERAGLRVKLLDVLNSLSNLAIQQGRFQDATRTLLRVAGNTYSPREATDALHLLARLTVEQHHPELSAALLGASERLLETHHLALRAPEQADRDVALEPLRATLTPETLEQALERGRRTPLSELLEQIQRLPWEPRAVPTKAPSDDGGLSGRELEVLRLLAHGLTNKQIARDLGVSPNTVKFHLVGVYNKLGCSTRAEASRLAVERGLA